MFAAVGVTVFGSAASFSGAFQSYVPVMLTSDRAGLVLDPNAKVKLRGVQVGQVGQIRAGENGQASLRLEIDPDKIRHIPANVQARISATTILGTKFVELVDPPNPSRVGLAAGAVLHSENVSIEVNTVFENVVDLLDMVDPYKLNAVLTAVSDGVRGQGKRMGEAITGLNHVLVALNARNDTMRHDFRSLKGLGDTYDASAEDIVTILNAASTTSTTIVKHAKDLDSVLLNVIGLSETGSNLLATSKDNLVASVNVLEPTTDLLLKYSPEFACTMQGATWYLDHGGYDAMGGRDSKSMQLDFGLHWGHDTYVFPDNLPIVAAKGGPGGKPGCGSLPDVTKNFPVRQLVTNTGWGTGLDFRPNPGIGQQCWLDLFRATRAVPDPVGARHCLPGPAVGPEPYGMGAPPYNATLYGPGGVPLWPGVAPAPEPASGPTELGEPPAQPDSSPSTATAGDLPKPEGQP